jgi:truncated hemoglobin YjbI
VAVSHFSIDDVNLYEQLGRDTLVALSTRFYDLVYADKEPAFRGMFPKDKVGAIQNQYEFLIQRLGGPTVYSDRKGHPALRARHAGFTIGKAQADKWLVYMRQALDHETIPADARRRLEEFFTDSAYFLQNIDDQGKRLY